MTICLRLVVVLFSLQSFAGFAQAELRRPDTEAQFPGGTAEMYKFLGQNIRYPEKALKANISGRVFLQLQIDSVGHIVSVELLRGPGFGIDEECIRVVNLMPLWLPATILGRPVLSIYNLPINICPE